MRPHRLPIGVAIAKPPLYAVLESVGANRFGAARVFDVGVVHNLDAFVNAAQDPMKRMLP